MSEVETAASTDAEVVPEVSESAGSEAQASGTVDTDALDPVKAAAKSADNVDDDPEIDFGDGFKFRRSEARRQLEKRKELDRASFKRFEDASAIQKRLDRLKESDPEEYFKERGIDPVQFAYEKLQREVAMREATPEQRQQLQREQALADREQKIVSAEQQHEQRQFEAERSQMVEKLDRELPPAMQKLGLPVDQFATQQVANVLAAQLRNDIPLDIEGAAEIVKEAYTESFKKHAATLKYEDAVKQYPEFVKVIREGDLARAKAQPGVTRNSAPAAKPQSAPTQPKKRFEEFFDNSDWAGMGIKRPAGT